VLTIRRPKLYYTASGIITPVGGRLVHRLRAYRDYNEMHGQKNIKIRNRGSIPDRDKIFSLILLLHTISGVSTGSY
jgi:hypothetical protein